MILHGSSDEAKAVALYVGEKLHHYHKLDLNRYVQRCAIAVPLGSQGGAVFAEHPTVHQIVRVDLAAEGTVTLPHPRTTQAILQALRVLGYGFVVAECWRRPKLTRYWRKVGLTLFDSSVEGYGICLTS